MRIHTIGYEGVPVEEFVSILKGNGIELLVDVRANPFSRKKGFSKNKLSEILSCERIGYLHIPELGIPSSVRKSTPPEEEGSLMDDYERDLPGKGEWIRIVEERSGEKRIALMCYERDVNHCHRGRIGKYLRSKGYEVADL